MRLAIINEKVKNMQKINPNIKYIILEYYYKINIIKLLSLRF